VRSCLLAVLAMAIGLPWLLAPSRAEGVGDKVLARSTGAIASTQSDTQGKIYVAINAGGALPDSTLYTLNPDGSGQKKLFDFHQHPQDKKGGIWDVRAGSDTVYFASDNAYLFTPASRNLFRIAADGSWYDQITPGPNSGRWDQSCPCGTVTGMVLDQSGSPAAGRPLFLEGKDMIYSGADGRFRFDDVPTGTRWIVAYRSSGEDVFDAQAISVQVGQTTSVTLTPNNNVRMEFSRPVPFGQRIYHVLWPFTIQWTTADFAPPVEVYKVSGGACPNLPSVDGFNVAPTTGRLAIVNYETGCGTGDTTHQGIYTADKDGHGVTLLVNMLADSNWCGAKEIFWSPDEARLAVKACYNWYTYLLVFDAGHGKLLGSVYFNDSRYTLYNVDLHGWSPDGKWLLYSFWLNDMANSTLAKMPVKTDGKLDPNGATALLTDRNISGATWGMVNDPSSQRNLYLPFYCQSS